MFSTASKGIQHFPGGDKVGLASALSGFTFSSQTQSDTFANFQFVDKAPEEIQLIPPSDYDNNNVVSSELETNQHEKEQNEPINKSDQENKKDTISVNSIESGYLGDNEEGNFGVPPQPENIAPHGQLFANAEQFENGYIEVVKDCEDALDMLQEIIEQ